MEEEGHLGHEGSEDSLDQMPMHVLVRRYHRRGEGV